MIAMAMACNPKILIADEPTTALDVTVQAQIFDLMNDLQQKHNAAILLITHDMGSWPSWPTMLWSCTWVWRWKTAPWKMCSPGPRIPTLLPCSGPSPFWASPRPRSWSPSAVPLQIHLTGPRAASSTPLRLCH